MSSYKIAKIKKENLLAVSSVTSQAAPSAFNSSSRKCKKKKLPKENPEKKNAKILVLVC